MKKLSFSIIIIFISSIISFSQNWHLVDTGKINHYSLDTTNLVFSIYADSLKIEGTDTIYYNNRVILPCDTCNAENYPNLNATTFYLINQALFLQRNVKISSNGIINLYSPDSLIINLNDSIWTFNNDSNIQAQLIYKGNYDFLGISDSVLCFTVDSSDTIIISKNYGVVQWPCKTGIYFRLIGVEGINPIGYHIPTFDEIYNFQINDVIHKEESEGNPEESISYYENLIITDIFDSLNNINYQVCGCKYIAHYTWDTSFSAIDTINTIINTNNYFSVFENSNIQHINFPIHTYKTFQEVNHTLNYSYIPYGYYVNKVYIQDGKTYFEQEEKPLFSINYYNQDSLNWDKNIIVDDTYNYVRHNILIIEGVGLQYNDLQNFETGISFAQRKALGNQVCEACVVSFQNNEINNTINVFPNPSNGVINISVTGDIKIELYNILGKKVYSEIISNTIKQTHQINLENNIASGIYFVNITSNNKSEIFKLIIKN